ncbi:hypothetical protein PanWU01x14_209470, partial [Parasponia andersonii]
RERESRKSTSPRDSFPSVFGQSGEIVSRRLSSCSSTELFVGNQEGDHSPDQSNDFRE